MMNLLDKIIVKLLKKMKEILKENYYKYLFPNRYKYIKELEYWKFTFNNRGDKYYWRNDTKSIKTMFAVYCKEFNIHKDYFKNKIVVDIGCGPMGTLSLFKAKLKFGIDILAQAYDREFDIAKHDIIYLNCQSHKMPFLDNFVDVVISRNALDHVDDFEKTIDDIFRILKPDGEIILSINSRTVSYTTEPQILSIARIKKALKNKFIYTKTPSINRKEVKEGGFSEIWIVRGKKISNG